MIRGDVRCEGQERWFGKAGRDKFMHANRLVKLSHFFQLVSFKRIEILMVLITSKHGTISLLLLDT